MRILTITQQYPPARYIGAELYDHNLNKFLIAQGHTVEVITAEKPTDPYVLDDVVVNPLKPAMPDIILTHIDNRGPAHYFKRVHNINVPIVGILHNLQPNTLKQIKIFNWDGIIFNSNYAVELVNPTVPYTVLTPPTPKPLS